jgi:ANTAR domain/PAS fold
MAIGDSTPVVDRVGAFRYLRSTQHWEWSDAVAGMHGYPPGTAFPTTELVLSHKHPADAARVALVIERMVSGEPFSSRHRIIDTAGATHQVLVVADKMLDAQGKVIGSEGFYIDLTEFDTAGDAQMDSAVADFAAHRAHIEQAKGMLMVTYDISADRAFDILVWRSQETNTKLRDLATQLVEDFPGRLPIAPSVRSAADHVLLTVHARVDDVRRTLPA